MSIRSRTRRHSHYEKRPGDDRAHYVSPHSSTQTGTPERYVESERIRQTPKSPPAVPLTNKEKGDLDARIRQKARQHYLHKVADGTFDGTDDEKAILENEKEMMANRRDMNTQHRHRPSMIDIDRQERKNLLNRDYKGIKNTLKKMVSGIGKGIQKTGEGIRGDLIETTKPDDDFVLGNKPAKSSKTTTQKAQTMKIDPETGEILLVTKEGGLRASGRYADLSVPDTFIGEDGLKYKIRAKGTQKQTLSPKQPSTKNDKDDWMPSMPMGEMPYTRAPMPKPGKNPLVKQQPIGEYPYARAPQEMTPQQPRKSSFGGSILGAGLSAMSTGQFATSYGVKAPSNEAIRSVPMVRQGDQGYKQHPLPQEIQAPHPQSAISFLFGDRVRSGQGQPQGSPQNAPQNGTKHNLSVLGVTTTFFNSGKSGSGSSLLGSISTGQFGMAYGSGKPKPQAGQQNVELGKFGQQEKKMTAQAQFIDFFRTVKGGNMAVVSLTREEAQQMASRKPAPGLTSFNRMMGGGRSMAVLVSNQELQILGSQQRAVVNARRRA